MTTHGAFYIRLLRKLCLCFVAVVCVNVSFVDYGFASPVKESPTVTTISPVSVFFIIDNSGSMGAQGLGAQDAAGSRFRVIHDFIDTIKAKFDSVAEVGVAVFGTYLCYNPVDNPIFKTVPAYDTGSYIPLLGLNMSYPPSGSIGYDILRFYLDTTVKTQNNNSYVDLKYTPTPPFPVGSQNQTTCINAGFDAARDAFSVCTRPKDRQFIIFLSDGEANQANGTDPINKYVDGTGVPTTFTVFFTRNTLPPANLATMTDNIKANGYSSKNPSSDIWAIQTDYPVLMKLLMDSVLTRMVETTITQQPSAQSKALGFQIVSGSTKGRTLVKFRLEEKAFISLKVYDIHGKLMFSAINKMQPAGSYSLPVSTEHLSTGNYIIVLDAPKVRVQRRIAIVY